MTDWQSYWDKKRDAGEARPAQTSSHRARKSWNDYSGCGIYHITIVTHNRQRVFGELNRDLGHPQVILTKFGQFVAEQWLKIPDIQSEKGRKVSVLGHQVMPDHFHGVLRVEEPMDVSMGCIIRDFKAVCTKECRRMYQPSLADLLEHPDTQARLERMSHRQREEYYASIGAEPLFDDNYDDTICYRNGQLANIIRYVQDNPRRAILRAMQPDFFKRIQHITINGVDFAAYGNLFLLRRPWKEHVTPGISKGEQQLVKDCMEQELPLIHLQSEPIGTNWHPEYKRYELCASGKLLILSPWQLDEQGDVNGVPADTAYSRFHNLNDLARQICDDKSPDMLIKR